MSKIKVPFGNLKKQYLSIKTDIDKSIGSIIDSSSFIRGDDVKEFERRFAKKIILKIVYHVEMEQTRFTYQ